MPGFGPSQRIGCENVLCITLNRPQTNGGNDLCRYPPIREEPSLQAKYVQRRPKHKCAKNLTGFSALEKLTEERIYPPFGGGL